MEKETGPILPSLPQQPESSAILNNCSVARDARWYNHRHDLVLQAIAAAVRAQLSPTAILTADLSDYNFPLHIVPTDLRPDLVWWDEVCKSLRLAELTVCFETNFAEAAQRKTAKYLGLVEQARTKG